jgi:two-component system, OmpR family, response regulator MprA
MGQERRDIILIVDGADAVRDALESVLELEGFTIHSAPDGAAAVRLLPRIPRPAVILFDLPPLSFEEVERLQELHLHPEWGAIPVVAMTSEPERLELTCPVLAKPFGLDELLAYIRAARGRPS